MGWPRVLANSQDVIDEVSRLLAELVGAATAKIPILSSDVFQSSAAELISYMILSYLTSIEPPDMKGEIVYSDRDTTDTTRTFSETSNSYKPSLWVNDYSRLRSMGRYTNRDQSVGR